MITGLVLTAGLILDLSAEYRFHLRVDTLGNVFVFLGVSDRLALIRFVDESELLRFGRETKWINVRGNWYMRE